MAKSKQYNDNSKKYDRDHLHSDAEAVAILKSLGTKKFDETVDIVIRLGVDPRKVAAVGHRQGRARRRVRPGRGRHRRS